MEIYAKPILKSTGPNHRNIVTLEACYPRFIHGEVMTHRVLSRNAMSSRAIPVAKMLEQVRVDPVVPINWGKNQKGMQADELVSVETAKVAERIWRDAAENASRSASHLANLGIHKQIANRLLEPFQWMRTIITSTEWDNFLELRDHSDAEPHFQVLAKAIRNVLEDGKGWQRLKEGEWHLPYLDSEEKQVLHSELACRISAARCARVSYLTHEGKRPDPADDLALFESLAGGRPLHASPLEHQARAEIIDPIQSGNLRGFTRFRKLWETQVRALYVHEASMLKARLRRC